MEGDSSESTGFGGSFMCRSFGSGGDEWVVCRRRNFVGRRGCTFAEPLDELERWRGADVLVRVDGGVHNYEERSHKGTGKGGK